MHASVLRYFVQVARSGSIRKASDVLGISASAVNRQILLLEQELGTPLFERTTLGMRLNQAGERLYNHAQSTLTEFELVRGSIDVLRGQVAGEVRISTLSSLNVDFLPSVVKQFAAQNPAVRYEIRECLAVEVIDQVASGESDIGFGFVQFVRGALNIIAEFSCPVGVIVSSKHPLAKIKAVSRAECMAYPIVTHSSSLSTLRFLEPVVIAQLGSPNIALRTNSLQVTEQFVRANLGITFATPLGFRTGIASGELSYIPFSETDGDLRIALLTPRSRKLPPQTVLMLEVLRKEMQVVNDECSKT